MQIYFTESQIPELKPLPRPVRQAVSRHAFALMRERNKLAGWLPSLLCAFGGVCGSLLGVVLLAAFFPDVAPSNDSRFQYVISNLVGVGLGACCGGYCGVYLQFRRLQPYLRRTLEEFGVGNVREAGSVRPPTA